jgi:16S rRNA (cytidine1402-2'-O)-methyltransferase
MLYFVATPIGNLEDCSARALRVLREVSAIGAEDTRHTLALLTHFQVRTPLFSFHQHNERQRCDEIVARLRNGEHIAIVSDAGMPLISDAGHVLAARLHEEGLLYTCVPGASAVETALVLSGLATATFQFLGFAPREKKERAALWAQLAHAPHTSVVFESPQRLGALLQDLAVRLPQRRLAVVREISKVHEETRRGTAVELTQHFSAQPPRGECVVVIEAAAPVAPPATAAAQITDPVAAVRTVEHLGGVSRATAVKIVAALTGVARNQLYAETLHND